MEWREKNDDDGDDLELSLRLKSTSQKSSLSFPFSLPSKQPLPSSLNGIASQPSSASKPNNLLAIDMNNSPMEADTEPQPPPPSAVSSLDSTVSSVSRKRSDREENELENYSVSVEGVGDGDSLSRKKLRLSKEQVMVLEETFKHQCTLSLNQKNVLARQLNLQTRQVEVWFQNRRQRTKTTRTMIDCRFLKIQYANLAEENRRLKKEVAELKALNNSPQPCIQMNPSTTLTMCLQCEHATVLGKSSPATSSTPPEGTGTGHWLINRFKESCN